jgi:pyruvate/2-oxoglutarate dehydrogenase complex dihydrolipoamide acyltransferase (E2) component
MHLLYAVKRIGRTQYSRPERIDMSDERLADLEDAVRVLAENVMAKAGQSGPIDSLAVQYTPEDERLVLSVPDGEADGEAIDATEAAVALAEENDIDLANVEGSGEDGRILVSDVEDAIAERDTA